MRIFVCNHDEANLSSRLITYLANLDYLMYSPKFVRSKNIELTEKLISQDLRAADVVIGVIAPNVGLTHPYWEWADLNNRPLVFVKFADVPYISHRFISMYTFDCTQDIDAGFAALAAHLKRPITSPMEIQAFTYRHPLAPTLP